MLGASSLTLETEFWASKQQDVIKKSDIRTMGEKDPIEDNLSWRSSSVNTFCCL